MGRKRTLLTVTVAALVVLAGCATMGSGGSDAAGDNGASLSEAGDGTDGGGGDGGGGDPDQASGGDAADGGQAAVSGQPLEVDRAIVRTGTVELRVDDFDAARSATADHARDLGGYVAGSGSTRHTRDNQSWTTGYVVVRIPSGRFSGALSHARDRGTVIDEETQTEDVTDRLVDLEARLTNLEERRDRLRSFYERANSTGELLRIEGELSSVQSEIEQLEAEKRALEDRVAFATLRVELNEPEPDVTPEEEKAAGASLVSAFLASVATLGGLAYGFVLFTVRLAPFVLFLGLPALGLGLAARRRFGAGRWFGGEPPADSEIGSETTGAAPATEGEDGGTNTDDGDEESDTDGSDD